MSRNPQRSASLRDGITGNYSPTVEGATQQRIKAPPPMGAGGCSPAVTKSQLTRTVMIDAAGGRYEIVRLLPEVDGVPLYRIKNPGENHERVAKETDLKRYG